MGYRISLGKWSEAQIETWIAAKALLHDVGEEIQYISGHFLEIPYRESTLAGGPGTEEDLVINFSGVDCFTFLDYVEAMRHSSSFDDFVERLKQVRYRGGVVSYLNRNHFFTDWREYNKRFVKDVTKDIGGNKTRQISKLLNERSRGAVFLEGIPLIERVVDYIPAESIDAGILDSLKTGDYIGIYTHTDGLDVSHVGIAIKFDDSIYFRHASSADSCRKVTDRLFMNYLKEKPGIVVIRPQSLYFEIFHG